MRKIPLPLAVVFIFCLTLGCTTQQTVEPGKTPQQSNAGTIATGQMPLYPTYDTGGCPSPYDGTYSGFLSSYGELKHYEGKIPDTKYNISYTMEVTFRCAGLMVPGKQNVGASYYSLYTTHVKVSDPYFDCTNGCTPVIQGNAAAGELPFAGAEIPVPGERGSGINIKFPNGKMLQLAPLQTTPDAKMISEDSSTIGARNSLPNTLGYCVDCPVSRIEYVNCKDCADNSNTYIHMESMTWRLVKLADG